MKILHIIPDDKFWESPIQIFSSNKYDNEYISIVSDSFKCFKYIATEVIIPVSFNDCYAVWNRDDIDVFMFHSVPPITYSIISSIPEHKVVIVASWGYDIYTSVDSAPAIIPIELFKKQTSKLLQKKSFKDYIFILRRKKNQLLHYSYYKNQRVLAKQKFKELSFLQQKMISRVDYWSTVLPYEYKLLKTLKGFKAEYFPFQYSASYHILEQSPKSLEAADYILLGNSADPTNNHLDVLSLIKSRGIHNQLYIPLAYGDANYAKRISAYILRKSIHADIQWKFISFDQYQLKLSKCRAAIFGHIRQQSVGNINIFLLLGKKVFLYKESIAYKFYKEIGCFVYSIEDDLSQESVNQLLTKEQVRTNIEVLSFFSFDKVKDKVEKTLMKIESKIECQSN